MYIESNAQTVSTDGISPDQNELLELVESDLASISGGIGNTIL